MKFNEAIKMFLMGAAVALLAVIVFRGDSNRLHAADGAMTGDGMIAMTVGTNSAAGLYLINTVTKNLAYYSYENSRFELRAGRYYKYDLGLTESNKSGGISVKDAKKQAEKDAKNLP